MMNIVIKPFQELKFYPDKILINSINTDNADKKSKTMSVNSGIYPAAENYAHVLSQFSFKGLSDKIINKANYCNYCGGEIYTEKELNNKAEKLLTLSGYDLVEEIEKILNEIVQSEEKPNALLSIKKSKNSRYISFFEDLRQLSTDLPVISCSELIKIVDIQVTDEEAARKHIFKNLKPLLKTADHTIAKDLIKGDNDLLLVEACHTCNTIKDKMSFSKFAAQYPEIIDYMPEEKYEIATKVVSLKSIQRLREIIKSKKLSEQEKTEEINKFLKTVNDNQNETLSTQKNKNKNITKGANTRRKIEDLPALIEEKQILQQQIDEQKAHFNNLSKKLNELSANSDLTRLRQISILERKIEKLTSRIDALKSDLKAKKGLDRRLEYLEKKEPSEKEKKKIERDTGKTRNRLKTLDNYEKTVIPGLKERLSEHKHQLEDLKNDFKTPDELKAEIQSLNKILDEEELISEKLSKIESIDENNAQIHTQLNSLIETLNQITGQITNQTHNPDNNEILVTIKNIDTFTTSLNTENFVIKNNESVNLQEVFDNLETTLNERRKDLYKQIEAAKKHVNHIKILQQRISMLRNSLKANESARLKIAANDNERISLEKRLEELCKNPPAREKITGEIKKLTEKLNSINSNYSEIENVKNGIEKTRSTIASMTKSLNDIKSEIYSLNQQKQS